MTATVAPTRQLGRSVWAIVGPFLLVVIATTGVDQIFHLLQVYPPWGAPFVATGQIVLALSYRVVFDALGSYMTARMAPYAPMRHVWWGACVGTVLSLLGVVATIAKPEMGVVWYPVVLTLTVFPTAWLGGTLFLRSAGAGRQG
jgi:hypothetical protein